MFDIWLCVCSMSSCEYAYWVYVCFDVGIFETMLNKVCLNQTIFLPRPFNTFSYQVCHTGQKMKFSIPGVSQVLLLHLVFTG